MAEARVEIPFRSDRVVRFAHPTDVLASPQNPLDNSNDGATCSFKAFDAGKSEVLSQDEAALETVLSVTNPGSFEIGDVVEVDLDGGTSHDGGAVVAVSEDDGEITITNGLASSARAGSRVRALLGSEVPMAEYGTARLGTTDWGFQATLLGTHPAHAVGREVDLEITFVGAPGGGLTVVTVVKAVIVGDSESCC